MQSKHQAHLEVGITSSPQRPLKDASSAAYSRTEPLTSHGHVSSVKTPTASTVYAVSEPKNEPKFRTTSMQMVGRSYEPAKRVFDFFVGLALLIVAFPIILVAATAIRLESRGPAFFVQTRLGTVTAGPLKSSNFAACTPTRGFDFRVTTIIPEKITWISVSTTQKTRE